MHLVMPMAGRGSRFADAGIQTPKPLIDVRGKPMYAWAMDGLPLDAVTKVTFLCLKEHLEHRHLRDDIEERYASLHPTVVSVDEVTEGQACTCLLAEPHLDPDDSLLIFNADTYCRVNSEGPVAAPRPGVDGVLGVFRAEGDKWSFARTDETGRVVETAEKRRISDWASTGLYHFGRSGDFVEYTRRMVAQDLRVRGEFYVAPLYNLMIEDGKNVRIDPAEEVWVLGTPEDLACFEQRYPDEGSLRP